MIKVNYFHNVCDDLSLLTERTLFFTASHFIDTFHRKFHHFFVGESSLIPTSRCHQFWQQEGKSIVFQEEVYLCCVQVQHFLYWHIFLWVYHCLLIPWTRAHASYRVNSFLSTEKVYRSLSICIIIFSARIGWMQVDFYLG